MAFAVDHELQFADRCAHIGGDAIDDLRNALLGGEHGVGQLDLDIHADTQLVGNQAAEGLEPDADMAHAGNGSKCCLGAVGEYLADGFVGDQSSS